MKTPEQIREELAESNPEARYFDGLDKALVGRGQQYSHTHVVAVYDYEMCVAVFVEQESMTYEEAVEWMDFNVACLWCGPNTPIILSGLDSIEAAQVVAKR